MSGTLVGIDLFFCAYFVAINCGYLVLNLVALLALRDFGARYDMEALRQPFSGLELPVTVIVPAYNEERTLAGSVRSLLQLTYPEFEIVVVNDGSTDGTLAALLEAFSMMPFPEARPQPLATERVRGIYRSTTHRNLRVIDKENGGKADALNAGINHARYPLYCAIDADSVLQRDSLWRVVEPFLEDPRTIASGGTVRVANGCTVDEGFMARIGLPRNPLALLQIVEYLRAFLFGRLGWSPLNAVLIISGAFGVFRRDAVVRAGGYDRRTVGEDMELVLRLHRQHRLEGRPYRIAFVPDPICYTEVPESLAVLKHQRMRWHRGLSESLMLNRELLFHRRGGAPGWLAMPFALAFEWLSPLVEFAGYAFMLAGAALGLVSTEVLAVFLLVAVGFGIVLSVSALLLEELSFRKLPRLRHLLVLLAAALVENLGYRQLMAWYRLRGLVRWAAGRSARWGNMSRSAAWQQSSSRPPPEDPPPRP